MKANRALLLVLASIVLLSAPALAATWDNVGTYNSTTKEMTITDNLGLGSVLMKVRLVENSQICSTDCHAIIRIENFENVSLSSGMDDNFDFTFYDGQTQDETSTPFSFQKATNYSNYTQVSGVTCASNMTATNATSVQNCTRNYVNKQNYSWTSWNYQNNVLPTGVYWIQLNSSQKSYSQDVEWIPTFIGVTINQWAKWGVVNSFGNFTFDVVASQGTDTGIGPMGNLNFPSGMSAITVNTVDGNATMTSAPSDYVYNSFDTQTPVGAWVFWVKFNATINDSGATQDKCMFAQDAFGSNPGDFDIGLGPTCGGPSKGHFGLFMQGDTQQSVETTTGNWTNGTWYLLVFKSNATGMYAYVNGTKQATTISTSFHPWYGVAQPSKALLTTTSSGLAPNYTYDEARFFNVELSDTQIMDIYNTEKPAGFGPRVNMTVPLANASYTQSPVNITFNCSATDDVGVLNLTLRINGGINFTVLNNTANQNLSLQRNNTFTEGKYNWTCTAWDGSEEGNGGLRTFIVDVSPPNLTLNQNISNQFISISAVPTNVSLNFTASDVDLESCFFRSTDNATFTLFPCNTTVGVPFYSGGNKTIEYGANDSVGFITTANVSFLLGTWNSSWFPDTVAEGGLGIFNLTLTYPGIPASSAYFTYNNTVYSPQSQVTTTNETVFGLKLAIPFGYGNSTGKLQFFNWTFNVTGIVTNQTTETGNQTVIALTITNCSQNGTLILNFTHRDEDNRSLFPVDNLSNNNLQVDLALISLYNDAVALKYNATVINNDYLFVCVPNGVLNFTSYKLNLTGSYIGSSNGTDYVQKFFYIDNETISLPDSPRNYDWYDLPSLESTSFLFTFINAQKISPPNVIVHVLRRYIGIGQTLEVERSKQDNNGQTIVHLVEEDVIYRFNISLYGQQLFLSDEYTAKCLQNPCSITLTEPTEGTVTPPEDDWDNLPGGTYDIRVNKTTRDVFLDFNLNDTALMNLTIYTSNSTGDSIIASGSTLASVGTVTVNVPYTYGNFTFYAVVDHDNNFVSSQWVDLTEDALAYFGAMGLFFTVLTILILGGIGISQGEMVVIWGVIGVIASAALSFTKLPYAGLILLVLLAISIVIKIALRRRIS